MSGEWNNLHVLCTQTGEIQEDITCFSISHKHAKSPFSSERWCWKCAIRFTFKPCNWNTCQCPICLILPALPRQIYRYFNKTIAPCPSFSTLCVCNRWHILMRPSARSNQTASGFLETWPVCETETHSARYSLLSSYPFLFCHLSTSPRCGNPSQVRTKWVTQGGSQLEHVRPCIRFLLDSAPAGAY